VSLHADSGLSPLLIEHEPGGSGVHAAPWGRRWQWLPVSPDDSPFQWANADIWEQYPLAGQPPLLTLPPSHPTALHTVVFCQDPAPVAAPIHSDPAACSQLLHPYTFIETSNHYTSYISCPWDHQRTHHTVSETGLMHT